MKTVIIRCEDRGRVVEQTAALLAGAKTSHLQQLAQAGAVGAIRSASARASIRRRILHSGLLGIVDIPPAHCYVAAANMSLGADDAAWCCDLVTQRDGVIEDSSGGQLPTKESRLLIRALNERLGTQELRWHVGEGTHHLLVAHGSRLEADNAGSPEAPELLVGQSWRRSLPRGSRGETLGSLIEQAAGVLEEHEVNRVRVDLGENPANLMWLWGAARGSVIKHATQPGGRTVAVISGSFFLKGLAACAGFRWIGGPESLDEAGVQSVISELPFLVEQHDLVYVHLEVDSADPVERLCAMERLDQLLLKPLTERLPGYGPWRLLVAVDDVTSGTIPFVAIGTGLPQQPVSHLTAQSAAASPLVFEDGAGLFQWLMNTGQPSG